VSFGVGLWGESPARLLAVSHSGEAIGATLLVRGIDTRGSNLLWFWLKNLCPEQAAALLAAGCCYGHGAQGGKGGHGPLWPPRGSANVCPLVGDDTRPRTTHTPQVVSLFVVS